MQGGNGIPLTLEEELDQIKLILSGETKVCCGGCGEILHADLALFVYAKRSVGCDSCSRRVYNRDGMESDPLHIHLEDRALFLQNRLLEIKKENTERKPTPKPTKKEPRLKHLIDREEGRPNPNGHHLSRLEMDRVANKLNLDRPEKVKPFSKPAEQKPLSKSLVKKAAQYLRPDDHRISQVEISRVAESLGLNPRKKRDRRAAIAKIKESMSATPSEV
jgi:hypothetical protein